MVEPRSSTNAERAAQAEVMRLRDTIAQLTQENADLRIALQTTAEHGDAIEQELYTANQQLQAEIAERQRAQAALQDILATVTRDKQDLELILEATTQHGDIVEYQLYTQAVETMRQSEALFRAIAESTSILMILTQQPDGAIAYANSVSGQQLGIAVEQLIGTCLFDFFANPDDLQALQQQLAANGVVKDYELQLKRADDTSFWVAASMCTFRFGEEETLLTTLYDISDRKQAEIVLTQAQRSLQEQAQQLEACVAQRTRELQETERKYRSIFENAAEGIFQSSLDGRYLSANPALAKIYGYDSPAELIASLTNIGEQLYAQPRRRDELLAYLRRFDSVVGFESQIYRQDGSVIWVSENVRTVKDETGKPIYYEGSVRDITERRLMEEELRQQRKVSERLLLNVLPQPIAERLKRGQETIADSFAEATVLFADIVNFTKLSAQVSPAEVVDLLNAIFSEFDLLLDHYELEKVKTIGDAYMVVAGVPTPRPDHISATADLALEMLAVMDKFHDRRGPAVNLRLGMHTGPVTAGVIGKRRFIYDLWGDTVNVASRMESQGETGHIQVTDTIYERLHKRYQFQSRGAIAVKGKGLMSTYWLMGRKTNFGDEPISSG